MNQRMQHFMSMSAPVAVDIPKSTLERPVLTYAGGGVWCLHAAYRYTIADGPRAGGVIVVPEGFLSDLSSVPRAAWWLIAPFELSITAPLVHDALYRYGGRLPGGWTEPHMTFTRAEADALFRHIMKREGVARWRRAAAHTAVRRFGGGAWGRSVPTVTP